MQKKYNQIRTVNFEDDIHCMPMEDFEDHLPDANCWCNPKMDEKNLQDIRRGLADKYVWVHNQIKYSKEFLN